MSHRSLDQLIADFQSCQLPRDAWTHQAHLRVGAWHVHRLGAADALVTLRAGIRRLNDGHGTVEEGAPFDERLAALVASPLGDRSILLRYWSRERLMSPEVRAAWLAPDLGPLVLPG